MASYDTEAPKGSSVSADDAALLEEALTRFKSAYDAHQDDFRKIEEVQRFVAGEQWPEAIRREREQQHRPCLTLDHLSTYTRHVVNTGLLRYRDVRILPMSGEADDEVAEIIAGIARQVSQTSTAKVAYETGLRHAVTLGCGYWRVGVRTITGTDLNEIVIRKIREPRMVMMDPSCEYPDGRDARYAFVFSKLTREEFDQQYPGHGEDVKSWHSVHHESVLPWSGESSVVLAEYYYQTSEGLRFAIMTPSAVLMDEKHFGDAIPIIRVVGDEYEVEGKERRRGMLNDSSMDAGRAYHYCASAFIENAALAPLAPFVAADGQIDPYVSEWKEAHRIPRAVLRYKPISISGTLLPPPQRSMPAGIPEGWQGMMQNLVQDAQMIMGLSQPNMLGTGGIPVQSGAGIEAQQEPGDVNTYHYIDHWHSSIEQTGRVIVAMIPHVFTTEQVVKIVGEDGSIKTAMINPNQQEAVLKMEGLDRVMSTSYNPLLGRYDAAISTGPASATKKSEASRGMMTMVASYPAIMDKAGDIVAKNLDIPGADVLAKRLRAFLPPGVSEENDALLAQQLQQAMQENEQLKAQMAEAEKIILAEREKAQGEVQREVLKSQAALERANQEKEAALIQQSLSHEGETRLTELRAQVELEKNIRDNIVKIIVEQVRSQNKLDVESLKMLSQISQIQEHDKRMEGYAGVMGRMGQSEAHQGG